MPVAFALGAATCLTIVIFDMVPISLVAQKLVVAGDSFPLLAIPFFTLAGEIMAKGGISERLVSFGRSIFGSVTGAMGIVTVFCCAIFAAISGSGPATVAAIGGIMVPYMLQDKYDDAYASTLASVGGTLGPIIPPSVAMIMYGVATSTSITDLFLAGVMPGILIMLTLCLTTYFVSKKYGYGVGVKGEKVTVKNVGKKAWEAKWAILMPVIILGGIYTGAFTPTEAAVVACVYGLIIGMIVTRDLKFKELPAIIARTGLIIGKCVIMVGCAIAFGEVLTLMRVPTDLANWILGFTESKIVVLLLINILLLIVGMFFETLSAILILAPLLIQVVAPFGVDPVHFGLIIVTNLVIGQVTPPVGVNLFVGSSLVPVKVERMFKWLPLFLAVLIIDLMIITYVPSLSLSLLTLFE